MASHIKKVKITFLEKNRHQTTEWMAGEKIYSSAVSDPNTKGKSPAKGALDGGVPKAESPLPTDSLSKETQTLKIVSLYESPRSRSCSLSAPRRRTRTGPRTGAGTGRREVLRKDAKKERVHKETVYASYPRDIFHPNPSVWPRCSLDCWRC
jgi:hypothetical protein